MGEVLKQNYENNKTFDCLNHRQRKTFSFNPDEMFIEKAGKKINIQNWIDQNTDETNIYRMIEKYHGVENIEPKLGGIIGDLTEYNGLKDILDKEKKAQNAWNDLPIEIRNQFGNNKYNFIKNGMTWAKNKQKEFEQQKYEYQKHLHKVGYEYDEPKETKGEVNNG